MAVSRIQKAVFDPLGLPYGDYSIFASQVECLFKNPVVAALDEYGVPIQLGERLSSLIGEDQDLDVALQKLRRLDIHNLNLDPFEKEILHDAQAAL